jgi:hypothetical protein
LGVSRRDQREPWADIDLAGLLCRLLVTEAIIGHGPCLSGPALPWDAIRPFELLPPIALTKGDAMMLGVVAAPRWFGVTTGTNEQRHVYASPVDRARLDLVALDNGAFWYEIP